MAFSTWFISQLGLSVRFTALRCLCIAVFVIPISDIANYVPLLTEVDWATASAGRKAAWVVFFATPPIGLIHNVASAFGPMFSLPGGVDTLFTLVEVLGLGFRTFITISAVLFQWPQPLNYLVVTAVADIFAVAASLVLFVVRCSDLARLGGRSVVSRYNFTSPRLAKAPPTRESGLRRPTERPPPLAVLTGRALWKAHFIGETKWIIILRAIAAIALITSITGFAIWNIVFQPIQEMSLTPNGQLSSWRIPPNAVSKEKTGWYILMTSIQVGPDYLTTDNGTFSELDFEESILVKALWPGSDSPEVCPMTKVSSGSITSNNIAGPEPTRSLYSYVIQYHCPPKQTDILPDNQNQALPYEVYIHPDFLVSVNYSHLGIPLELNETGPSNIIHAMLGFTDDTLDIFSNTSPTTLFPGVNLVGMSEVAVRQQLGWSFGGLFLDTMRTFLVSEIRHVWADPRPVSAKVMPTGSDIATVRIKAQAKAGDWKILQDHREKTVLNGFANVGGLWTFLEGMFALLFGSSLLKIILGQKPLSFFGAAHSLQSKRLREACSAAYPRIQRDITAPGNERGLLRMIVDHLLDVSFLAPPEGHQPSSSTAEPIELEGMHQKQGTNDENKTLLDYDMDPGKSRC